MNETIKCYARALALITMTMMNRKQMLLIRCQFVLVMIVRLMRVCGLLDQQVSAVGKSSGPPPKRTPIMRFQFNIFSCFK